MKLAIAAAPTAVLSLLAATSFAAAGPRVLVNHIGYDARGSKKVIVQSAKASGFDAFQVVGADGRVVLEGKLEEATAVFRWTQGFFYRGTFSDLRQPGVYRIVAKGPEGGVTSEPFTVAPRLLAEVSISDALYYLKSQRSSGIFDQADRRIPFFGEAREPVDVHGGWFDAAGDMTVFDRWTKDVKQREISAYATQEGHKSSAYQAGFREGGGMAIAALARAATLAQSGEFSAGAYLAAAEKGFAHLQEHNLSYLDDHQENVIDDYCALLAAVELHQATRKDGYLAAARSRRDSLVGRLHRDQAFSGFWRADASGERPFFHATDAGLPVVALLRYIAVEPEARRREEATKAVLASLQFELAITREVANPFGYARQYVRDLGRGKRSAFFFPHQNESGYWWEGESARLASLAAAAFLGGRQAPPELRRRLEAYAVDQLDWTFGLNPFDASMQRGQGRNAPDYSPDWPSAPGGVASGITSGFDDELDIALLPPPHDKDPAQDWRWSEQWLPHGAWLVLALAAQQAALGE